MLNGIGCEASPNKQRYTSQFLYIQAISDRYEVVGSSLRHNDVQISHHEGGYNKHKSRPGQRNSPASASLWRWQGRV